MPSQLSDINNTPWYTVNNIDEFDSPCLVLYKERIEYNIKKAIERIGDAALLRPHVKTNKIAEVCGMMMHHGVSKFKCATIAEAEMLAMIEAKDILLAYQPVGPRIKRFFELVRKYPSSLFSCIVDNTRTVEEISSVFAKGHLSANVYIDLNSGMNRTGSDEMHAYDLIDRTLQLPNIHLAGIHAYDGHVRDADIDQRQRSSDFAFQFVGEVLSYAENKAGRKLNVIAGGSPSFATHIKRHVECSPGTFVFWDWGYHNLLPDEPYQFAAVVVTRVISIINERLITTDLGHKAIAAENPFPRMHFLNRKIEKQVSQSEEHLTLQVEDSSQFVPGDVLYAVPLHICPTVALYDTALVAEDHMITGSWQVVARARKITI